METIMSPALASLWSWYGALAQLALGRPKRVVLHPPAADVPSQTRRLVRGTTHAVRDPAGCVVECVQGVLWITHDGDPKDIVLTAGQAYRAQRPSRMLVSALEDAEFVLA